MIETPAIITPIQLVGRLVGWHYCAETGLYKEVFDKANTINNELKAIVRDNLNSTADFALDNFFTTDGQKFGGGGHAAGDPTGKDGIIIWDDTNDYWLTMVTAVHPVDPSGSYYRQWQGVLTNDFSVGSFIIYAENVAEGGAKIGNGLNAQRDFAYLYAIGAPEVITMAANDILTVNWTITVG